MYNFAGNLQRFLGQTFRKVLYLFYAVPIARRTSPTWLVPILAHNFAGNSQKVFGADFPKSPLSFLHSTPCMKDFSYLIGVNFSNPKTGYCTLTNQSCHEWTVSEMWLAVDLNMNHSRLQKRSGHRIFYTVQQPVQDSGIVSVRKRCREYLQ